MKKGWKVFLIVVGIILYAGILVYISSIQSMYDVKLTTESDVYEFEQNESKEYVIPVHVDNRANRLLSSGENEALFLSYHLYDANGNLLNYDGMRSRFTKQIFAGHKGMVDLHMNLEPGEYRVDIDIVEEFVTWFNEHENTQISVKVFVK